MRDIAFIVRDEIVANMNNVVSVKSFVGNVLTTCGVKWAAINKVVTDSALNEYRVLAVNYDTNTIELTPLGAYTFSGTTLNLNVPSYFTGTPTATDAEWRKYTDDETQKTPFIWLVEPTSEVLYDDTDTSIARDSNIHIVFLDSNNVEDWLTLDTHENRLQSLYNMRDEFIGAIKRNLLFEGISNSTVRNLTKFGTESSKGFEQNIIAANLTGVDNRLTVSIYKTDGCNC